MHMKGAAGEQRLSEGSWKSKKVIHGLNASVAVSRGWLDTAGFHVTGCFYSPSNNNVGKARASQMEEIHRQYSSN